MAASGARCSSVEGARSGRLDTPAFSQKQDTRLAHSGESGPGRCRPAWERRLGSRVPRLKLRAAVPIVAPMPTTSCVAPCLPARLG